MKLKAVITAILLFLASFTLVLINPQIAGATTTTYNTTADAFTASDLPNTVENTTYVSMDASPLRYGYYKFAVTVPAGEAVTSAVFKCWPGSSNTSGMGLWTTTSGWSETTLTWNNAPVPNFGLPASGNTGAVTSGSYSAVADVTSAVTGTGTYTFVGKTTSATQWSCTSKENSGNHPAQLIVTSSAVDNPPVAALTVTPNSGNVPLAVTADASASTDTDSTPISTYTFAWGDGTPNTGPQAGATAPHTFTVAGNYTVTVTVTDTVGKTGTTNKPVTVSTPTHSDTTLPARGAFYYPWYPETWGNINSPDTHYNPTLGFYDSSAVAASHIASLAYGNFGFAISSWWGQGSPTDGRTQNLLNAAHGTNVKIAPYYEAEGNSIAGVTGSPNPTSAQITSDLNYLTSHYTADQNYMYIGGKPVIFAFGDGSDNCGMVDRWIAGNNAATQRFYVVLKVFGGYAGCATQPDNWHQYGPATAEDQQGTHSISVSPGYWKYTDPTPLLTRDLTRWHTNVTDMNCATVDFKLVTTFNEWGEGTAVESATQWSSGSGQGSYLDELHNNATCAGTDNPPVAALTVTPSSGTIPFTVNYDASASTDTDATPISTYTFNPGDGSANIGPQASATASHSYTTAGTFTVTVTVTDTGGLTGTTTKTVIASSGGTGTPVYDHIFYVMFENHNYSDIIGNANAPYLNSLTNTGSLATNYHAVIHPSVNNYLAAISGQTYNTVPPAVGSAITDNCTITTTSCSANAANLTDRLETAGKTWKGYMETMPSPCYGPHDSGLYTERHNPFPYFNQIRNTPARCAKIVPYTQLATDLTSAATTPNFVWVTPNLCNDMHNACAPSNAVTNGDTWASQEFPKIFNSPAWTTQHSLLVINEDENGGAAGNIVPAIFVSSDGTVVGGRRSATNYTHYSLLRTIEDSFGVSPVGPGDTAASSMVDMFH